MQVRLEVAHEKANVRTVVVKSDVVIGRSTDCQLRIASSEVSRRHCLLSVTPASVRVRDLGSSNGTFVDGRPISPETDVPLSPGSSLSIGGIDFVVRFDAPAPDGMNGASHASEGKANQPGSQQQNGGLKALFGLTGRRRRTVEPETTELPTYDQDRGTGPAEDAGPGAADRSPNRSEDARLGDFLNHLAR